MVQNMHSCKGNTSMKYAQTLIFASRGGEGEREKYYMASLRNNLEEQRGNLRNDFERPPPPVKAYYLENIAQLTARIDTSQKQFPMFRGDYDN